LLLSLVTFFTLGCEPSIVPQLPRPIAPGTETSPAFAFGGPGAPPRLVVGFNGIGGQSVNAWAHSTDGFTWTYCDALTPGCGGPGAPVPLAQGLLGQFNQTGWRGDPAMVASVSDQGVVVSVNLGNTTLRPIGAADSIVASVSFDSGQTFSVSSFVNDQQCGIGASEDQPSITVDPGLIGTHFWVVWRHLGTELGVFGACIRAGDVDPISRTIRWAGPPSVVTTRPELGWGVGGLISAARNGVVTVVYNNTDQSGRCGGTIGIGWRSVVSLDNGKTWEREREIFTSNLQPTCLPSVQNRLVNRGIRDFGFAQAPDGTLYVAVPDDNATAVRVYRSTNGADTWFLVAQLAPPDGSLVFFPTLAVDADGRALLAFQSIDAAGTQVSTWVASNPLGTAAPRYWLGPDLVSGPFAPPANPRLLGDYNGIAVIPRGSFARVPDASFFPTWTRTSIPVPVVEGALTAVLP
jgi:hypothetical protein